MVSCASHEPLASDCVAKVSHQPQCCYVATLTCRAGHLQQLGAVGTPQRGRQEIHEELVQTHHG